MLEPPITRLAFAAAFKKITSINFKIEPLKKSWLFVSTVTPAHLTMSIRSQPLLKFHGALGLIKEIGMNIQNIYTDVETSSAAAVIGLSPFCGVNGKSEL